VLRRAKVAKKSEILLTIAKFFPPKKNIARLPAAMRHPKFGAAPLPPKNRAA
jgi:hypothetical protein